MIQFSTETLDPKDKFPFWCDIVGGSFQETNLSLHPERRLDFSGSMAIRTFDDFEIFDSQSTAHETTQTRKNLVDVDEDYLWLYRQIESREVCAYDGVADDVHLHPGEVYIYHPILPCTLKPVDGKPSKTQVFRFHKRHLTAVGAKLPSLLPTRRVSGDAGAARLLTVYVNFLADELTGLSSFATDAALGAFYGLAAAAYGTVDGDGEPVSTAIVTGRITLAKKIIARQSDNPALSAAMVARVMHVSERTLHRAFELSGESFSGLLSHARLERCQKALRDPRAAGQLIATIAYAAGFDSLATFNRQFRRAYGMSPSDWRQMRRDWR